MKLGESVEVCVDSVGFSRVIAEWRTRTRERQNVTHTHRRTGSSPLALIV